MSGAPEHTTFVESFFEKAFVYRRQLLLAAFTVLIIGGSAGSYWWYRQRVASLAHKAYADAAALLSARVLSGDETKGLFETAFASEEEKWQAAADAFKRVDELYPHVGIGAMAAVARVQALVHLGKFFEARTELAAALSRVSSAPLRSLYSQMLALLQLDSGDAGEQEKGLVSLQQLAANKDSVVHDSSLYHLGAYHWYLHDFDNARNYWQQLLLHYDKSDEQSSGWVAMAKEKLTLIERA